MTSTEYKDLVSKVILVTGASGFIATHVVNSLLEKGYHVRCTVRSEDVARVVRKAHSQRPSSLSICIVPDMQLHGAFDEAVKGVYGVSANTFQPCRAYVVLIDDMSDYSYSIPLLVSCRKREERPLGASYSRHSVHSQICQIARIGNFPCRHHIIFCCYARRASWCSARLPLY